jgi:hypothetical protein
MLPNLIAHFRKDFPKNQDLLEISILDSDIKIVGFKHKEVQLRLTKLIEKLKQYEFPTHWENIPSLIEDSSIV